MPEGCPRSIEVPTTSTARPTARVLDRNRRYFDRYPEDADRVRAIVDRLESGDARLPDGERLSAKRFLQLGFHFGMSDGFEKVHYILERAFVDGVDGSEVGYAFLCRYRARARLRGDPHLLRCCTRPSTARA